MAKYIGTLPGLLIIGLATWGITRCMGGFPTLDHSSTPARSVADDPTWRDGAIDAQAACIRAIKSSANNPSSAIIPYAANTSTSGPFFFHWARGDGLRLQNGFGAMLDTEVMCAVDGAKVVALVIDGKRLIYDLPNNK